MFCKQLKCWDVFVDRLKFDLFGWKSSKIDEPLTIRMKQGHADLDVSYFFTLASSRIR